MITYTFELYQNGRSNTFDGGSNSEADAKCEAVRFLGELLKDGARTLPEPACVTVLKDRTPIYRIEYRATLVP
jgi:hypothetical protein